jgi:uncharacterized membrane protein
MASTTPSSGPTNLGVAPNLGGLLCYLPCCVGLVFSIVVAAVEKRSGSLRFHAFQSLLLHGVLLALCMGLQIVHWTLVAVSGLLGLVFSLVMALVGLAVLGLMIFLMVKAYGNESFELPVIGEMARKWAS